MQEEEFKLIFPQGYLANCCTFSRNIDCFKYGLNEKRNKIPIYIGSHS